MTSATVSRGIIGRLGTFNFSIAIPLSNQALPSLEYKFLSLPCAVSARCQTQLYCQRHQSTTSAADNTVLVPPTPSWSVRELRLTASTEDSDDATTTQKISDEELAILARRCLIDVRRLTPEKRDQLRIDIAGIMRCASVLLDARNLDLGTDNNHGRSRLTDAEVYDDPRGLGKLPIRRDFDIKSDSGGDNEKNGKEVLHGDDWRLHDSGESIAIMRGESVKRKMLEKDGEMFFSVVTKG